MPGPSYEDVVRLATDHHGHVSTAMAREHGVSADALRKMVDRGTLERVSRGVYRVPILGPFEHGQLMAAALWPHGRTGVLSHASALTLYGFSDASPSRIHLTLPTDYRIRREVPEILEIHHADLEEDETRSVEGMPVTTPERTLHDCHEAHLGPRLLRQAIGDALREGYLTPAVARSLSTEILPTPTPAPR